MGAPLLAVEGLRASVNGVEILKGINLTVNAGEVHAVMGPNGSGKSTLANVLAGHPSFESTAGSVRYAGADLLAMSPDLRAREGLFLAFQYPVEVPGVRLSQFLRSAYNAVQVHKGLPECELRDFSKLVKQKMQLVKMDPKLSSRALNEGFSGGEKKRNEVLQMAVLEPRLAVLDETDSGLDVDALRTVAEGVNSLRRPGNAMIVVTHYQRLLDYIVPDRVHVLIDGRIVLSGGKELGIKLEAEGYDWVREQTSAGAEA